LWKRLKAYKSIKRKRTFCILKKSFSLKDLNMDFKDFFALLFSFLAFVLSLLIYKQNKHFENENHIFKLKIDTYLSILRELQKLINLLDKNINYLKDVIATGKYGSEIENKLSEEADIVDEKCGEFQDFIVTNSLIIPENILNELMAFCDKVMATDSIDGIDTEDEIKMAEKFIDDLILDADKINEHLRVDLQINKLNNSLYKRLV